MQSSEKNDCNLNVVKTVVKKNGADLAEKSTEICSCRYWGIKEEALRLNIKDGGLTAVVAPTTEYAEYVEYGTRFMESQPYVRPALGEQKQIFKKDLEKVMK